LGLCIHRTNGPICGRRRKTCYFCNWVRILLLWMYRSVRLYACIFLYRLHVGSRYTESLLRRGENTHAMQTPGPRIDPMHLASAVTPFWLFSTRSLFINGLRRYIPSVWTTRLCTRFIYSFFTFYLNEEFNLIGFNNNRRTKNTSVCTSNSFEKALRDLTWWRDDSQRTVYKYLKKSTYGVLLLRCDIQQPRIRLFTKLNDQLQSSNKKKKR